MLACAGNGMERGECGRMMRKEVMGWWKEVDWEGVAGDDKK